MLFENHLHITKAKTKNHKLSQISTLFIWVNVLDLLTTAIALPTGKVYETNPYVLANPSWSGWSMFFLYKLFAVGIIVFYYEFSLNYVDSKWIKLLLFIVLNLFTIDMLTYVIHNIILFQYIF